MYGSRVRVTIMAPAPSDAVVTRFDINPQVTDCSYSSAAGIGWDAAAIGMQPDGGGPSVGYLPRPIDVALFNHVELDIGGYVVYAGQITQIKRVGRGVVGFTCNGYGDVGLKEYWYSHTPVDGSVDTAGTVLKAILGDAAPLIGVSSDPDLFVDSGIRVKYDDFDGMTPADAIAKLSTAGGGSSGATQDNAPYDWLVYENRIGSFLPRKAPPRWEDVQRPSRGAPYWIDLDADVEWTEDASGAYGSVTIQYTPTNSEQQRITAIDATFTDRYGLMRALLIDGGQMDPDEADQRARSELALRSVAPVSVQITRKNGRGLRRAQGGEQPPELIRACEYVQVADQQPVILLSCQMNATRREWTATGQNYARGYWDAFANLEAQVRAISKALNPVTGSRSVTFAGPRMHYIAGTGAPAATLSGSIVIRDDGIYSDRTTPGTWKTAALV